MAMKLYDSNSIQAIATAIRNKDGDSTLMTVDDMPSRISAINTGGGGVDAPTVTITYDEDWGDVVSVTCNKTYAECLNYYQNLYVPFVYLEERAENDSSVNYSTMNYIGVRTDSGASYILYTWLSPVQPGFDIRYYASGTLSKNDISECSVNLNVTTNGTYSPWDSPYNGLVTFREVTVNVQGSSGGGSSIFVTGDFVTGTSTGASSIAINYSGSGYPVACMVLVKNGAYNNTSGAGAATTAWYNEILRYSVGQWTMHKAQYNTTPTYKVSGAANYGVTTAIYKNSTSNPASYTRTSAMNSNTFSSSAATNAALTCVRFTDNKTLSYYVNTSSYGLMPSTTYTYYVVYSS